MLFSAFASTAGLALVATVSATVSVTYTDAYADSIYARDFYDDNAVYARTAIEGDMLYARELLDEVFEIVARSPPPSRSSSMSHLAGQEKNVHEVTEELKAGDINLGSDAKNAKDLSFSTPVDMHSIGKKEGERKGLLNQERIKGLPLNEEGTKKQQTDKYFQADRRNVRRDLLSYYYGF